MRTVDEICERIKELHHKYIDEAAACFDLVDDSKAQTKAGALLLMATSLHELCCALLLDSLKEELQAYAHKKLAGTIKRMIK